MNCLSADFTEQALGKLQECYCKSLTQGNHLVSTGILKQV